MLLNYYTYNDMRVAIVTASTLDACFYKRTRLKYNEQPPILASLQDLRVIPLSRVLEYRMNTLTLPCYSDLLYNERGRGGELVIGVVQSTEDAKKLESQLVLKKWYEVELFKREYCMFASSQEGYDWTSEAYKFYVNLDAELQGCKYQDEFDYICNVYEGEWEDDMVERVSKLDLSLYGGRVNIPVPLKFEDILERTERERGDYTRRRVPESFLYD